MLPLPVFYGMIMKPSGLTRDAIAPLSSLRCEPTLS
jgi:hypothetical protein